MPARSREEQPRLGSGSWDEAINDLVEGVRKGRPVVPLVGAGISVEAGVPPLSEVTRYLAKTKAYLRHRVFTNLPQAKLVELEPGEEDPLADLLAGGRETPPFRQQPRDFLREFGWPDAHELNSNLWHWLWRRSSPYDFFDSLDLLVNSEILESLSRIDRNFVDAVKRAKLLFKESQGGPAEWRLLGSYWKILLTHLTRSSPDLVDTLFQRLTRKQEPATAHRYFAFLTPVLRLRLFLTINFDTLLEDALRIEGFRPTVYEVADGLSLPHPKLVQEGLSMVKLHGGAYGLLVGDKLDSPLDEETRARFRAYLPEHLILLIMGIGGWDQRVLDMAELALKRGGDVWWLHFEDKKPETLEERFGRRRARQGEGRLKATQVKDPGAFLREVYSEFKHAHPSSSRPFQACDLRPVFLQREKSGPPRALPGAESGKRGQRFQSPDGRLVVFKDDPRDYGIGASLRLARFVARKGRTHLPVWIDVETKFTVEDLLMELIHQLRRYDPGLPPEILAIERSTWSGGQMANAADYRKVVRRLYGALARGRYVVAFSGVQSFGRLPTRHHGGENPETPLSNHEDFEKFLRQLLAGMNPTSPARREGGQAGGAETPESLGLLDSIFAFALDYPQGDSSSLLADVLLKVKGLQPKGDPEEEKDEDGVSPFLGEDRFQEVLQAKAWWNDMVLVLLTSFRRRRSVVALRRLMPKYLHLSEPPSDDLKGKLKNLVDKGYLGRLEGGDYWMSRKLRNHLYDRLRRSTQAADPMERIRALAVLTFVHQDLADYHHRDLYVGSQDVSSFLEELYHRLSALRHLHRLETEIGASDPGPELDAGLVRWLRDLAVPFTRVKEKGGPRLVASEEPLSDVTSLIHDNRCNLAELVRRRWLGLRALREVLEQEKEAMLSRVPSTTLQEWVKRVREDLEHIAVGSSLTTWDAALGKERNALVELLEDVEIEVLQDRLKTREVSKLRHSGLRWQVDRRSGLQLVAGDGREVKLRWWLDDENLHAGLTLAHLRALCQGDPEASAVWKVRRRVIRAMADVAQAFQRSTWRSETVRPAAPPFRKALRDLLKDWGGQEKGGFPVSTELLELRLVYLRLEGDLKLWRASPWDTAQGLKILRQRKKVAGMALQSSEQAFEILDAIREDRPTRSYFHSLKGRAHYLLTEYEEAYREFDLARAGLSETTAREREALAVALLRQAECLMVHSDEELTLWVLGMAESNVFKPKDESRPWSLLLSAEGWRKYGPPEGPRDEGRAEMLLRLSLANCRSDFLHVLEDGARSIKEHRRALTDTLGTMRSRLAAAHDLLDRVEGLLEHSRRKVEWWACLFQLRAQLAVERLLLLLSGDLAPVSDVDERDYRQEGPGSRPESENPWPAIADWLYGSGPHESRTPASLGARGPAVSGNPLKDDPELRDLRRRFINRFQGLLRQGVMAVRQGLDILLPDDLERRIPERLENDVLLNRILRLWTELMVCGAYATDMSRRIRPEHTFDDNLREKAQSEEIPERWAQWCYLNKLSGLVTLPRDASDPNVPSVKSWFLQRDWDIGPPGLSSRARILARMDLCLSRPGQVKVGGSIQRTGVDFKGGDALRRLHHVLREGTPPDAV